MWLTSIAGAFPRVGKGSVGNELRSVKHTRDEAKIKQLEEELIREIVRLQQEAGMDLITDGLVRWDDPVSHFATKWGAWRGDLHHFLGTNFHVRRAVVEKPLEWVPVIYEEAEFLKTLTKHPLCVLPDAALLAGYTISSMGAVSRMYSRCLFSERRSVDVPVVRMFGKCQKYEVIEAVDVHTALMEDPKEVANEIRKRERSKKDSLIIPNGSLELL